MLANNCRNRPEQNGEAENTEPEGEYDDIEGLVLEQANFLEDEERIIQLELPITVRVFLKSDMVLPVNFPIQEWTDLFEFFRLAIRAFQRIDGDRAVRVSDDFRLAEWRGDRKKRRFEPTAGFIQSGNFFGIGNRLVHLCACRGSKRKVSVKKRFKQNTARIGFSLTCAVVRDKESDTLVEDQVQVAVKILGVATVADDSLTVARFLVKAVSHGIQAVVGAKEPRMHEFCRFGLEDLLVAELAILQMGDHKIAHIPRSSRHTACRKSFDKFKRLGLFGSFLVAIGHHWLQVLRKRLNECGALHVERRVDIVLDILFEGLLGNALNDVAS